MSVFDRFRPKNTEEDQRTKDVAARLTNAEIFRDQQAQKKTDDEQTRRQVQADREQAYQDRRQFPSALERAIDDQPFRATIRQEIENPGTAQQQHDPPQETRTAEQMQHRPVGLQRPPSPAGANYGPPTRAPAGPQSGRQPPANSPTPPVAPTLSEAQQQAPVPARGNLAQQARDARAAREEAERVRQASLTPEQRQAEVEERILKNVRSSIAYDELNPQLQQGRRKPWER